LTQYGIVYGGGAGGAPVSTAAGTTGQFLGANTGGAPTWQTPSGGGSPGGSNTQVQYNSSGSFAGSANLTFDGSNLTIQSVTAGRGASNNAFNTVFGNGALTSASAGNYNTAFGYQSSRNTTGAYNVAIGSRVLFANTTGTGNSGVGEACLYAITSGANNQAFGQSAGEAITTGSNNTCIGFQAGADSVRTITTNSNEVVVGNNSVSAAYIKVSWTVTSDARDKTSFAAVTHGLTFVNSLTPTAYRFRVSREDDTPTGPTRYGFKAQDILAAEGDNPIIIDNSDPENLKYNADSMIAVLVNAIKQLSTALDAANARIAALEAK
jgi:hypothetical protein